MTASTITRRVALYPARRRRLSPRPPARARAARRSRRGRVSDHGIEVPAPPDADRKKQRKFSARSGTEITGQPALHCLPVKGRAAGLQAGKAYAEWPTHCTIPGMLTPCHDLSSHAAKVGPSRSSTVLNASHMSSYPPQAARVSPMHQAAVGSEGGSLPASVWSRLVACKAQSRSTTGAISRSPTEMVYRSFPDMIIQQACKAPHEPLKEVLGPRFASQIM